MYWKKCGNEITGNQITCPNCGAIVSREKTNDTTNTVDILAILLKPKRGDLILRISGILLFILGFWGIRRFYSPLIWKIGYIKSFDATLEATTTLVALFVVLFVIGLIFTVLSFTPIKK